MPADVTEQSDLRHEHWRRTRRLTLMLALTWFAITFGIAFFARELSQLSFFGWPLSFYLAAQGAVLAYTAVVGVYAWKMQAIDRDLKAQAGHAE